MGRLTIEQAIEYWKIFLDEIEELRATPGIDPKEWDEQEKATVAALEALVKQRHYEDLEEQGRLIEQKHGHWEEHRREAGWGMTTDNICSACHEKCWLQYDYCPHCGAKMKLKELEVQNDSN